MFLHNFRQFLENWIFEGNSTGADLTKIVKNLVPSQKVLENNFWQNYLFLSSREVFLHNFRQFLENWIFDGNLTGADLTKNSENLALYQIVLRKYFLAKLFIPLIKRSVFSTILGNFCKLNFRRKFDRRGPYKNSENLALYQIVLRNTFWLNYLFHSSKEVFLHNYRQFLENWIFEGNLTGSDLTKIVKFSTISNCAKKILFG